MEEISARFEIIRLAFKMADYDVIDIQAKRLKEISYDDGLNEISELLLSKNYRQSLFMMNSYLNSAIKQDDQDESTTNCKDKTDESAQPSDDESNEISNNESTDEVASGHDEVSNLDKQNIPSDKKIDADKTLDKSTTPEEPTEERLEVKTIDINLEQNIGPLANNITKEEQVDQSSQLKVNNMSTKKEELATEYPSDSLFGETVYYEEEIVETNLLVDEPYDGGMAPEDREATEPQATVVDDMPIKDDKPLHDSVNNSGYIEEIPEPTEVEVLQEINAKLSTDDKIDKSEKSLDIDDDTVQHEPVPLSKDSTTIPTIDLEEMLQKAKENFDTQPVILDNQNEITPDNSSQATETIEDNTENVFTPIEKNALKDIALDETTLSHASTKENVIKINESYESPKYIKDPADLMVSDDKSNLSIEDKHEYADQADTVSSPEAVEENIHYKPILHIDQKYRNMMHQFPQLEISDIGIAQHVKDLSAKISTSGYNDEDIYEALTFYDQSKAVGNKAEAAQMLLLLGATESKLAQLMLARELFKGEVLEVDFAESFTQINRLAEQDYPEAICDLAQLYEFGYGINKDKKIAKILYEEASSMGVERATKHLERLSQKKGIFGSLLRR